MKIIILNESKAPDPLNNVEKRCAATPSSAQRLVKKGATLLLEAGAGVHSGYSDKEYKDVGVTVIDDVNDALSTADMLVAVNKPTDAQLALMKKGAIVVGHLDPFFQQSLVESIAEKGLTAISVEMIPRSSRAQKNGRIELASESCGLRNGDAGGESVAINITYDDDTVRNNKTSKGIYYWSRRSGSPSHSNRETLRRKRTCL
ncbi:hypothetical protein KUL17_14710 [Alteromonas sp. KUL17]|nr:hypothetical protein KUL17_14710 [Alteromonas sp. KUL17]